MNNISAVIVTYNEEDNIKGCIEGLNFVDEVIVVDTDSTDRTKEIAKEMGAKVINSDIQYPEAKKNIGMDRAKNSWILVVDADERITSGLAAEIREVLDAPDCEGYWIYRKNYFLGYPVNHGGWESDKVIRLFKKEKARYPDKRVHAELELDGKAGFLKNKMEHHSYKSVDDYFTKVNRYTKWNALDAKGKKVTPGKLFANPLARFVKMYFLKLGFLDGTIGFVLAVTASFSVFTKYLRIYLKTARR
ncbi:MAG: glycosyltransferase family 2 protein [Elusimicrobiota bacterium]